MTFDTEYFRIAILKSRYRSQRQLSRHIIGANGNPLDPSALSLLLRGKRQMQIHEARQLADLLDLPLADVLIHAGVEVRKTDGF
jgi:hypothetical protein